MSNVHELASILKRAEERVKARPERLRHDDPYYVPPSNGSGGQNGGNGAAKTK
jgi:hypothetical protein